MSTIFLFPGQGEQYPGMLDDLPAHPAATASLDEMSAALRHDIRTHDDARALRSNASVQLALLGAAVASWRILAALGARPDYVAGHSIGAFAAAVACGALALPDAVKAVWVRGHAMAEAYPHGYGMGVVLGLDERGVTRLADQAARSAEPVYPTNVNAPRQITTSGADPAVDCLLALAHTNGATRAQRLPINVPAHCPLMAGPERKVAAALSSRPVDPPSVPFAANCDRPYAAHRRRDTRGSHLRGGPSRSLARGYERPLRTGRASLRPALARRFKPLGPGRFPHARATSLRATSPEHVVQHVRLEGANHK